MLCFLLLSAMLEPFSLVDFFAQYHRDICSSLRRTKSYSFF